MADKLTIKQEKFSQGLFAGLSQREAYKRAFNAEKMTDKTIDEKACLLAAEGKIRARLDELTKELKERNMVTVEKVLAELAVIGFSNTTDFVKVEEKEYIAGYEKDEDGKEDKTMPIIHKGKGVSIYDMNTIKAEKLKALAGIKQGANGIEIKLHDKVKALELMGKHLGMFTDKVELTGKDGGPVETVDLSGLDKETLIKLADKL